MTPQLDIAPDVQDYLDQLALALAAGAKWWREQLRAGGLPGFAPGVTPDQLDTFESHLTVGLAKLVLHHAMEGTSRKAWGEEWVVQTRTVPDEVLREAAVAARIGLRRLPKHSYLKLHVTDDQVQAHVMKMGDMAERQLWPAV